MSSDFQLLETMRVLSDGEVFLLDRHLKRLTESAEHFEFRCDVQPLREAILRQAKSTGGSAFLRLTLASDGEYDLQSGPLPARNPTRLKLASFRVNSNNPFLYHKTTKREIYESAKREVDADTDVLLVNERGEITEITIANVAVLREGRWITPKTSCGLLNGVMRAALLDAGDIVEGVVYCDELKARDTVRCFNALRGMFETKFL
jgi:para-aminobenzoate synthetase / 4-amino-4-deoxychorismate lyase